MYGNRSPVHGATDTGPYTPIARMFLRAAVTSASRPWTMKLSFAQRRRLFPVATTEMHDEAAFDAAVVGETQGG